MAVCDVPDGPFEVGVLATGETGVLQVVLAALSALAGTTFTHTRRRGTKSDVSSPSVESSANPATHACDGSWCTSSDT